MLPATLSSILDIGSKIIDRVIPDKQKAEEAKIKLEELNKQGQLKELDVELEKRRIDQQSVASAQLRQTEIVKATGKPDHVPTILAFAISISVILLTGLLCFVDIDKEAMTVLEVVMGALVSGFLQVLGFYFGSSSCSRKKDDTISKFLNS